MEQLCSRVTDFHEVSYFSVFQRTAEKIQVLFSNKNTQLDATIDCKIYCFVVQTLLNVFRVLPCPSSGARQTAVAASGFRMNVEEDVFSAVIGLPSKLAN